MQISFDTFITIIVFIFGAVLAGVGWWVNQMWSMLKKQQELLAMIQVELAKNYVPRAELHETFKLINSKLDEIPKEMRNVIQQFVTDMRYHDKEKH